MSKIHWPSLLISIAIAEAVGALSGVLSGDISAVYRSLIQPPLSPPGWVFPIVLSLIHIYVSAKDLGTGKQQSVTITASSGLSDSEIDRMMAEAEQYKEEDEKRKKAVEIRNQGDSLLYSVDRSLNDLGDKVQDAEKETVEAAKKELSDALAGDDIDLIEEKTKALSEALYKITERIYGEAAAAAQQQQQNNGNATGPESGEASDFNQQQAQDFYDAEFHNVDDEDVYKRQAVMRLGPLSPRAGCLMNKPGRSGVNPEPTV